MDVFGGWFTDILKLHVTCSLGKETTVEGSRFISLDSPERKEGFSREICSQLLWFQHIIMSMSMS